MSYERRASEKSSRPLILASIAQPLDLGLALNSRQARSHAWALKFRFKGNYTSALRGRQAFVAHNPISAGERSRFANDLCLTLRIGPASRRMTVVGRLMSARGGRRGALPMSHVWRPLGYWRARSIFIFAAMSSTASPVKRLFRRSDEREGRLVGFHDRRARVGPDTDACRKMERERDRHRQGSLATGAG